MAPASRTRPRPEGVVVRHRRFAGRPKAERAPVAPASRRRPTPPARSGRSGRTFPSLSEARAWRQETQVAVRAGKARAPSRTTLAEASEEWLSLARRGIVLTRSGEPYKPSALRSYEEALRNKGLPRLGRRKLSAIERNAVQDLVDRLVAEGRAPSTVRNAVLP